MCGQVVAQYARNRIGLLSSSETEALLTRLTYPGSANIVKTDFLARGHYSPGDTRTLIFQLSWLVSILFSELLSFGQGQIVFVFYHPPTWYQLVGTNLVPTWYQLGTSLVPAWYQIGTKLVPTWYQLGTKLVTICYRVGTNLVPTWCQVGTKLVPTWYHLGTNLVPTLYEVDTKVVPSWYQTGTNLVPISYQVGTNLGINWVLSGSETDAP